LMPDSPFRLVSMFRMQAAAYTGEDVVPEEAVSH